MTHSNQLKQGFDANAELQSASGPDGTVVVGEGPSVVIFVPTFDELAFVYHSILRNLPKGFAGYAYSPKISAEQRFGPEERAAELLAFMEQLNIHRAHLVAWSDSAAAMSTFSNLHSDRVISRCYLQMPDSYKLPGLLHPFGRAYMRTPMSRVVPKWATASLIARLLGGGKISANDFYPEIRNMQALNGTLKHSILPYILHDVRHEKLPVPTLVVGGDNDWWISAESIEKLSDSLEAHLVMIPGGDHFLPWTSRSEVTPVVLNHLEQSRELS